MAFQVIQKLLSKPAFIFLVGMTTSFAFAPFYLLPMLPCAIAFLMNKIFTSPSYIASFKSGSLFGAGYFLGGLYWIASPLLLYFLQDYWWLVPFALFAPMLLGLYIGILAMTLHAFRFLSAAAFAICFACTWVLFEILRTELFTGFPWLAAGYSLTKWPSLIQSASLFGVFGLSFIVSSIGATIFVLLSKKSSKMSKICIACLVLVISASNIFYGHARLNSSPTTLSEHMIKIIQPNIYGLISTKSAPAGAENMIELAKPDRNEMEKLLYIVMPESALNFFSSQAVFNKLLQNLPEQSYLLVGGDRIERNGAITKAWASVFAFNNKGIITEFYDKTHLVPFGEYLPFRNFISNNLHAVVSTFLTDFVDLSAGTGPRTLNPAGIFSFSPLICYESLFPTNIIDRNNRPTLLINFTTDMWYGITSGPYQHFDMSIMRAVEYGIPLIRSATTGISGVADPYGRVLAKLELGKRGAIHHKIPIHIAQQTLFSTYGNVLPISFLICIFVFVIYIRDNKYLR